MSKKDTNKKAVELLSKQKKVRTFRSFIEVLKEHTSLPNSFYATRFNRKGALDSARDRFAEAKRASEATGKAKKKKKKGQDAAPEPTNQTIVEQIETVLRDFDLTAPSSSEVMVSVINDLLPQVEDKTQIVVIEKQVRKAFGLSETDFSRIKRLNIQQALTGDDTPATLEIDLIQKVTARYKEKIADKNTQHPVLYTMGSFYSYNKKSKIYKKLHKDTVSAQLYRIIYDIQKETLGDTPININLIQTESLKRVQAEFNGEVIFDGSDLPAKFAKSKVQNMSELQTGHTDIFTNVSNAQVASGDCYMYMNNAQIVYRTQKLSKKISNANVYEKIKGKESTRELLTLGADLSNHSIKGLLEVDTQRHGLYYNAKMPASYMTNKETLRAIANGKAKNFIHFLDCITENLEGREKALFITAYLDVLAYLMQPIKRHNCFFYFYGLGENGKSFGMLLLQACCGKQQIAKRPLEAANENPRFFASSLHGINAAYDDDIQNVGVNLIGMLKKYSNGNDVVQAELKNSNEPLEFLLRCSMVLLSNKKLSVKDNTKGMARRLYALNFGVDISSSFDRYKHGEPLLKNEVDVIFNVLRLRVPRVIKQGVHHTPAMLKETHAITNSGFLDSVLNKLKPSEKDAKVRDVLDHVRGAYHDLYGVDANVRLVSIERIEDELIQRGYTVDREKGLVKNVKIKKIKKQKS